MSNSTIQKSDLYVTHEPNTFRILQNSWDDTVAKALNNNEIRSGFYDRDKASGNLHDLSQGCKSS